MDDIDWDKVPVAIDWVAVDANGGMYGYRGRPVCESCGAWMGDGEEYIMRLEYPGWKESLQRRPKPALDLSKPLHIKKHPLCKVYEAYPLSDDVLLVVFHWPEQDIWMKKNYMEMHKSELENIVGGALE